VAWTVDQVLARAPNASVAHAAQGLAAPRKWLSLARTPEVVWGEYQGSAAKPYRVAVDLNGPAFQCSCPSRNVPCKHALGLMLVYTASPEAIRAESDTPEWLATGQQKTEKSERPADPERAAAEQEKRAMRRDQRVRDGIDDLERWLRDIAREGLTDVAARPRAYFDRMAARLVDAQATGLARRVRDLAMLPYTGSRWPERMLIDLGRLQLLLEAYRQVDMLEDPLHADVRTQVGFNESREAVLACEPTHDTWSVLGRRTVGEERLRVQRTWLHGARSGQWALVVEFAAGPMQSLDRTLVPGRRFEADACFYPGAAPGRALLREPPRAVGTVTERPAPASSVEPQLQGYAEALARNPWLERYPMAVADVVPEQAQTGGWSVVDAAGWRVPIVGDAGWQLVALSGGEPITVFGEWDGFSLLPLSAMGEESFTALGGAAA
jgi:hypothetical protein